MFYRIPISRAKEVGDYKLVEGAEFLIMEGPHIVGGGIVKDIKVDSKEKKQWES